MRAAQLHSNETKLRINDVPTREPVGDEVKISVKCCGVCGSDVHLTVHKTVKLAHYPRILGHEASGVVKVTGENVSKFKKGDRVVISAGTSCGHCKHCIAGYYNLCEEVGVLGFEVDGAFAEEIIVKEKYLTILPDSIPFDQGAILADAVSTPYHALKYTGRLSPGESVAIFGCGGLGVHAIALARALGASRVVALDVDKGSLDNAGMYGADELIDLKTVKNPGKALKELTGGVDVVCDFSGRYENVEASVRAMNSGGRIVMVGIGRNKLEFSFPTTLIMKQITIAGSYGADFRTIPELIDLYLTGKLDLSKSITSHHPLEEVNECLENLYYRKNNPIRYIIEPGK
ncbi:MAG: zinc-binding dehydrogenase [Leptospira sp.]|nr:zinc-binding dehydrogenase [Leptospira sp.]